MRKLEAPKYQSMELYDKCVNSISDASLKTKFSKYRSSMHDAFIEYDVQTDSKTWCYLKKSPHGKKESLVVGGLSKEELVNLYDEYVLGSSGGARQIYDEIKIAAQEECPYCGGAGELDKKGRIGTADHYLPKARFPAYSVYPRNLVPACALCNSCMGSQFPIEPSLQPLNPYFDELHFFNEKWTDATVRQQVPVVVDFFPNPPVHWSDIDKSRVVEHFRLCKLSTRYRTKVYSEISTLINIRKTVLNRLTPNKFSEYLMASANAEGLPINGWKRTLYCGLANSHWFCRSFDWVV